MRIISPYSSKLTNTMVSIRDKLTHPSNLLIMSKSRQSTNKNLNPLFLHIFARPIIYRFIMSGVQGTLCATLRKEVPQKSASISKFNLNLVKLWPPIQATCTNKTKGSKGFILFVHIEMTFPKKKCYISPLL